MFWICKGLFVSGFQYCKTFPLTFNNERVGGESSDQAATTSLGRKAQVTLNGSKLLVQVLQFCPFASADFLDLAFYDDHMALSLSLEGSGLFTKLHGTDQNL